MQQSAQQKTILVVDDMPSWREFLRIFLEGEGWKVWSAGSYAEANSILRLRSFPVATVDIRLKEGDLQNIEGVDVARQIRSYEDGTYIVMVSAYGTPEVAFRLGKELGVNGYMEKAPPPSLRIDVDKLRGIVTEGLRWSEAERQRMLFADSLAVALGDLAVHRFVHAIMPDVDRFYVQRELLTIANTLLRGYVPLAPRVGAGLEATPKRKMAEFVMWSRAAGHALYMVVQDKRQRNSELGPGLPINGPRDLVTSAETDNLRGVLFALPEMTLEAIRTSLR